VFFNIFLEVEHFAAILIAHGTHGHHQEFFGSRPEAGSLEIRGSLPIVARESEVVDVLRNPS